MTSSRQDRRHPSRENHVLGLSLLAFGFPSDNRIILIEWVRVDVRTDLGPGVIT